MGGGGRGGAEGHKNFHAASRVAGGITFNFDIPVGVEESC